MNFYTLRPYVNWALMIAAILGVIYIGYTQNNTSNVMKIATGERGSYLYEIGLDLKKSIENRTDYKVELVESGHSFFNRGALQGKKADAAIISPIATDMTNLALVAPIAKNHVQIIVHVDSNIHALGDLPGNKISLGSLQSDHRQNALALLAHYQIEPKTLRNTELSHLELLEAGKLDGAIVTSSTKDTFLKKVMASGNFKLLDIFAADGLAQTSPFMQSEYLNVGVYPSTTSPLPSQFLPSVTTESLIVVREDAADHTVEAILQVLMHKDVSGDYPLLAQWLAETGGEKLGLSVHSAAQRIFNPYEMLKKTLYGAMLTLWLYKWILLCVIVLLLSARSRWKGYRLEKANAKELNCLQHMQKLIEDINQHEILQADTKDYRLLTRRLAEVRKMKTDGIAVANDLMMSDHLIFIAFLQQCDCVIKDIQWKLSIGLSANNNGA